MLLDDISVYLLKIKLSKCFEKFVLLDNFIFIFLIAVVLVGSVQKWITQNFYT